MPTGARVGRMRRPYSGRMPADRANVTSPSGGSYPGGVMVRMRGVAALAAVMCGSGCVLIQSRYSVLGIDGWQTPTPEQARAASLAVLGAVAVVSAVLGAAVCRLVQRWRGGRNHRPADPAAAEREASL